METKRCSKCKTTKPKSHFHKRTSAKCGVTPQCKVCIKEYSDARYADPKMGEAIKNYNREYQAKRWREDKEHRQKHSNLVNKQLTAQRKNDPLFKLAHNTSSRIWQALKTNKSKATIEYIGCDITYLKEHLQEQFTQDMTWDNYGEWHVDHIIPIATANTLEELESLLHYTNLQPLWGTDNLSKGSLYEGVRHYKKRD